MPVDSGLTDVEKNHLSRRCGLIYHPFPTVRWATLGCMASKKVSSILSFTATKLRSIIHSLVLSIWVHFLDGLQTATMRAVRNHSSYYPLLFCLEAVSAFYFSRIVAGLKRRNRSSPERGLFDPLPPRLHSSRLVLSLTQPRRTSLF